MKPRTMTPEAYQAHQAEHGRGKLTKPIKLTKPMLTPMVKQLNAPPPPVIKPSKHKNVRVTVDGLKFASKREAARWSELNLMLKAGKIFDLKRQVAFVLAPAVLLDGRMKPALRYVCDFTYSRVYGKLIVEDVKSPHLLKNSVYRIKKHLLKTVLGLDVEEV